MAQYINSTEITKKWFDQAKWLNGLNIEASKSIDIDEFMAQYTKNEASWKLVFDFLKNTDLQALPVGKHLIDGDNVFVSVAEGNTKDFELTKWEAHKKYIDLQYLVSGSEKMGIAPLEKATSIDSYNETKDVAFFSVPPSEATYLDANPSVFFLFFPTDAHRPDIKVDSCDVRKKIVIKIKSV